MWNDPIVEESRRVGEELAARFNYDIQALGEYLIARQKGEGRPLVRGEPKRIPKREEPELVSKET